ncbi:MAG TPA: UvrD-helicase domain-containing protein, partial [Gaiellaceae bacterium]|nr:UvrD-helicase domain-containing protein [Gaiellaceae bacterium]
ERVDLDRILSGLNVEQRRAVEVVRGPVCILAGAGSGKTTTITRRIAWQVASGAVRSDQILAVTFTDKAAGEMRARLARLGVDGVEARTFHSAALAQLRRAKWDGPGRILSTKALLLRQIGNTLPPPYRFRPAGDLATEVEWAKNRRLTPQTYRDGLRGHEPPIPEDLMTTVFREYERRKDASGAIDFEDLLELAVRMYEEDELALGALRERYTAFTVDEYQDVNLLQQSLLELWLGPRDDLCAVGDDYQSIYGFTGASPEWLLGLASRYPQSTVVRLEENYRSSPQVLALANRLVPRLGGAEKTLRATRPEGPAPELRGFDSPEAEGAFVLERVRALHAEGVPYEEMAVLMRLNARSVDFEELFADAEIPFQGAALLARDGARQLLKGLRGAGFGSLAEEVRRVAVQQGLLDQAPDKLGERELVRQADLARLCKLAEEFDDGTKTVEQWIEWLKARFAHGAQGGVHLLTLHRAKGLEFDAVFLPRVEEKELPCKAAMRVPDQVVEERRLLYVGITRARKHLAVTWAGQPSRFLLELGVEAAPPSLRKARAEPDDPTYVALKEWRLKRSKADEIPAYVVFHNSTLAEIAARRPRSIAELASVPGVGPAKLERYGRDVLDALAS